MSRSKKKSVVSKTRILIKSKYLFSKKRASTLGYIRDNLHEKNYNDLIQLLWREETTKKHFQKIAFPESFSDIEYIDPGPNPNLVKEFRWGWTFLSKYSYELSTFISLSKIYEKHILLSEFKEARGILNTISDKFGVSIWLMKNLISFLQLSEGLESQKIYSRSIMNENPEAPIIQYIAHYLSYRTEPAVSPPAFKKQFDENVKLFNNMDQWKAYLSYHLSPTFESSKISLTFILGLESNVSAIDYYCSLIHSLFFIVASDYEYFKRNNILPDKDFIQILDDKRISNLYKLRQNESLLEQSAESIGYNTFISLFDSSQLTDELAIRNDVLEHPNDPNVIEIASKAMVSNCNLDLDKNLFVSKILYCMKSICLKDENYGSTPLELFKICWDFITHPWAIYILSFILKEMSDEPFGYKSDYSQFSVISSHNLHPIRILDLNNYNLRVIYGQSIKEICNNKLVHEYINICINAITPQRLLELKGEEEYLISSLMFYENNECHESIKMAHWILDSENLNFRLKATRIIANCLINLGKIEKSMEVCIDTYINERRAFKMLPIKKLVKTIDEEKRANFSANIALPILYDIYAKNVEKDYDYLRAYAYEDFLSSYGIEKPSELEKIIKQFDYSHLLYFLKNLCVEQIMDNSTCFNSSEEILYERVSVLRLLSTIDENGADEYQSEIRKILKNITIKKKIREIEQSKVYVDIASIKESLSVTLKENYNRYLSFLKDGLDESNLEIHKAYREAGEAGDIMRILSLSLPDNEMNSLFSSMIFNIRDQFVSSTEHGLDGYLSVRIRHGTFFNHLRSPLQSEKLITLKRDEEGNYTNNSYWIDKLNIEDESILEEVNFIFNAFSKDIDMVIEQIINSWIQRKFPFSKPRLWHINN
ncbi:MAG: hypothetical protein JEZ11_22530 [Desulfobacterales bacterium]|nr:hypothetical protein [Desulfobacterales bacterium]